MSRSLGPFTLNPQALLALFFGLASLISTGGNPVNAQDVASRPNIILFLIDDQDDEQIACYGGKTWTPNLNHMAAEGMRFTRAHVSSTVCTPSRYSFLTGRYAGSSTSKVYNDACGGPDKQGFPSFNVALEADRMNVGNVLREAGYVTGFVGKFHLESRADFPEFYAGDDGFRPVSRSAEDTPETNSLFAHNEQVARRYLTNLGFSWAKHVYRENLQQPYAHHNPEWTIEAALEFIEQNKNRPFYLHCCTTLLHGPDGSWRRSMDHPLVSGAGRLDKLPTVMKPRSELLKQLAAHRFDTNSGRAGEAWVDDAVGAILTKLKELKLDQNTLVVFAPDHGSRSKSSLFEADGTRIPLIARWPAGIKAGAVCDELVQNIDWVPTAFELANIAPPPRYRVDGRSLKLLFKNGMADNWRDHLYFEIGHGRAVATKDWSYIAVRYPQEEINRIKRASPDQLPKLMSYIGRLGIGVRGADRPGFWDADQLYDLQHDDEERNNLAADPQHVATLKRLKEVLKRDVQSIGRPFGEFLPGGNAAPPGQVDAQIEQVKKLVVRGKSVLPPAGETPAAKSGKAKRAEKRAAKAAK